MRIKELECARDLFGRLLYLSTKSEFDMRKIVTYPLTPVPLSLAHVDGSINKTNKAKLMHYLEAKAVHTPPTAVSATVVDAMFLLHTQVDIPPTYGGIAERLLRQLCVMSERVDFVTDTYQSPSIKDIERDRRGACEAGYSIQGPQQKRPTEWQKALLSPSFKSALLKFLFSEWLRPEYAQILSGHSLYFALHDQCHRYTVLNGSVVREPVQQLRCKHEEADTRVIFHVNNVLRENLETQVVVRANDTDILVLLVYHMSRFTTNPKVWMDAGTSSSNTRRLIDIASIIGVMEPPIIEALPAIHAFTGTDFTASFLNKGKIRPLELMSKSQEYTACFADLGNGSTIRDCDIESSPMENFVCAMYGKPKLTHVNEARYATFQLNYAPRNDKEPLQKIKGINASMLPPCQSALYEKVRRTNFVATVWKGASKPDQCSLSPMGNGWILVNGTYKMKWFEGDTVPQDVWRILDADTEALEEDVETDINDPVADELLYGPDDYLDFDEYWSNNFDDYCSISY